MASKKPAGMTVKSNTGVRISGDGVEDLLASLLELADAEVLVGFAADENNARTDSDEPLNAQLGYIHDNGAPESRIPARPFMIPGIEAAQSAIEAKLSETVRAVLREGTSGRGPDKARAGLAQTGFIAMNSIKRTINAGVPPPLSERTLRGRLKAGRKDGGGARKGAAIELDRRADGQEPSVEFAKPLVDTGQLRNAVTYAIRSRKKRS
ncbi:hypothetical protein D3C87_795800 [compost metagenome]